MARSKRTRPMLPVGTQVVVRTATAPGGAAPDGAVGRITKLPEEEEEEEEGQEGEDKKKKANAYGVRLATGVEVAVPRSRLTVRKLHQRGPLELAPRPAEELQRFVILRCVVGSRAYGLDEAGSDVDRRGIFLPPARLHWSLFPLPEQLERPGAEECYWELEKFLRLALKANPNVLEVLYTPLVEHATPLARELLEHRALFLSRLVYQTYNGYVLSQFGKLEQDLRTAGEVRWKHAMHLLRLLLAGAAILREGRVPVHVGEHRERLLAVRRGQVPWEELEAWRLQLHRELDQAFAETTLPERPDYRAADDFLIRARAGMVEVGP